MAKLPLGQGLWLNFLYQISECFLLEKKVFKDLSPRGGIQISLGSKKPWRMGKTRGMRRKWPGGGQGQGAGHREAQVSLLGKHTD